MAVLEVEDDGLGAFVDAVGDVAHHDVVGRVHRGTLEDGAQLGIAVAELEGVRLSPHCPLVVYLLGPVTVEPQQYHRTGKCERRNHEIDNGHHR